MKITVIGLGHVGIVAAAGLASAGHDVLGVDVDLLRVRQMRTGGLPLYEPGLKPLVDAALADGSLRVLHPDEVEEDLGQAALVATGTPSTDSGAADLGQVRSALAWVAARASQGLVLVMKSTVPPGTGRRLTSRDLKGSGLGYAANPEFLREGRAVEDWSSPDRIVIGAAEGDEASVRVVREMHEGIDAPHLVTDVTSAEMIKYASNAFLATRISFINEMASLCDRVGASIDAVSDGLAMDARTGGRIYAGVGYGGSCFPKDVRALDHLALTSGANVELLRSVINVNNRQRLLPLHAIRRGLGDRLEGARVGVLGLAFKPGTDDVRDAPSLDLIRALVSEGARVRAYDPHAAEAAAPRLPNEVALVDDPLQAASDAQALALVTEWEQIVGADWEAVVRLMSPPRFVYDGRNALDAATMRRLGFKYAAVGRPGS